MLRVRVVHRAAPNPDIENQLLKRLERNDRATLINIAAVLLRSMGYREVSIVGNTAKHGRSDAGAVDITAWISRGGVAVRTIFQVKAMPRGQNVQRRFVDELRGAMSRLGAAQALILSNGTFSFLAGQVARSYPGRPVRLIGGRSFAKLMLKNGVGVRLKPLSYSSMPEWMIDEAFFAAIRKVKSDGR